MALLAGSTPSPTGSSSANGSLIDQLIAQAAAAGGTAASQAVVPLWQTKPNTAKVRAHKGPGPQSNPTSTISITGVTSNEAEAAFLNMTEKERNDFARRAISAGLLHVPSDGVVTPADIASAWSRAVQAAANYNQDKINKNDWISPWEVANKLAINDFSAGNAYFDNLQSATGPHTTTSTATTNKQYTTSQLAPTIRGILQQELGRDPTQSELSRYTKVVQAAYNANPVKQTDVTTTDQAGNSTVNRTLTGGIDPGQTVLDRVQHTPEAQAQAANGYFNAIMQGLGAVA